jgi:DNA ligase-1
MLTTRRHTLFSLATWAAAPAAALCAPAAAASTRGAPPLMLAREAPASVDPAGFLVSEKYDGVRALWDGRQLRFRSGLPVMAPAWFTARFPATPLDGELWLDRGCFDALSATVRRAQPLDDEWADVLFLAFDLPGAAGTFAERSARLVQLLAGHRRGGLWAVQQQTLPDRAALQGLFHKVLQQGGEGLMLHRAQALWQPGRSGDLLKLKPQDDAEATVVGHMPGRGRLQGLLGALRVRDEQGREFQLGTGFSDQQRAQPPALGTRVTYTYRGRTGTGLPRFASFLRMAEPGTESAAAPAL